MIIIINVCYFLNICEPVTSFYYSISNTHLSPFAVTLPKHTKSTTTTATTATQPATTVTTTSKSVTRKSGSSRGLLILSAYNKLIRRGYLDLEPHLSCDKNTQRKVNECA